MSEAHLPPEERISLPPEERTPKKLYRAKLFSEVPKGAVLLEKPELLKILNKRIDQNKNYKKTWPLKYSYIITGATASISASFITSHFRKMFKLRNFGVGATYGAPVALSFLVASTIHSDFVRSYILTGYNGCELCLGLRSGAIQVFGGVVYPLVFAPLICILYARSHHTYSVPSFTNRSLFINMVKSTVPTKSLMGLLIVCNLWSGMVLCEAEMISYNKNFAQGFDPEAEKKEFFTDLK